MTNFVYSGETNQTCSRTAIYKNKEILIDGYTGVKGSGLINIMKKHPKASEHLTKYRASSDIKKINLVAGSISSASILTGLLYTGDKSNKNNFLLFGGIIALVNFLATKTIQFYSEKELTLAIEEFNKASNSEIRLFDQNRDRQPQGEIYSNKSWSF